jgi:(S)-mandelate dehydrogenase
MLGSRRLQGPEDCYTIGDLRRLAQQRLPRAIFDFFDGGAEDEVTLRANSQAFEQLAWRPHVLRDVSRVDLSTALFGNALGLPMAIAPTGAGGFGHPHADLALAKAAARYNIPYALSSSATTRIETIAEQAGGRLWFQAYVLKDRDYFWQLLARAKAAGYEGLIITVDLAVGGKRWRDFHNHFAVPFRITPRNLWDFAQHPAWLLRLLRHGMPVMENLQGMTRPSSNALAAANAVASTVGKNYDDSFDFARLQEVRDRWPGRLIVKGVARGDDAERIASMGCDALVVSNHGGRQLEGARASLHALPEVLAGVNGRVPVWMDGGIRHGGDVAKAVAMGAQGVLLGRATLYGAISGGEAGALRALEILTDELKRTLQLCGVQRLDELTPDYLVQAQTITHRRHHESN